MTQSQRKIERKTILPEDTSSAIQVMTQLTRQMLEFVLEEGKLLKEKDATTLVKVQHGKDMRAVGYTNAATEFRARMEEFKNADTNMIGKLEALTVELGKTTRQNQKLIDNMGAKKPMQENMANNLFLLQGEQAAGTAE